MYGLYSPPAALLIRLAQWWRQRRCGHYGWDRLATWHCPDCGRPAR